MIKGRPASHMNTKYVVPTRPSLARVCGVLSSALDLGVRPGFPRRECCNGISSNDDDDPDYDHGDDGVTMKVVWRSRPTP